MDTTYKWWIGGAIAAGLVGGFLYTHKATAADLGKECGCADLEERVAELEATVARKGNRKMTLTISGVVHKGVLFHNNDELPGKGKLSIYDGTTDPTRIRIAGEAKASKDWATGFVIEIAYPGGEPRGVDTGKALFAVTGPDGKNEFQFGDSGTVIRHSFVYVNGPAGRLSLGMQSMATDFIIEMNTSNTAVAGKPLDKAPMNFGGALSGLNIPFDGGRANSLRYDTPTIGEFMASAAWSDTDTWDAAIRYAGEFSGFRLAAGVGYRDQKAQTLANVLNLLDVLTFDVAGSHKATSGSASVMHTGTGLFLTGYYSRLKYDLTGEVGILPPLFSASFPLGKETVTGYGVQAGIEQNWTTIGKTTLFAEWSKVDGQALFQDGKTYGIGVIQSFDYLALDIYATFRRHETVNGPFCVAICKDMDLATFGARVKF